MSGIVIVVGLVIFLAGIALLGKPGPIFRVLRENAESIWLYTVAVVIRLLFGALLIDQAGFSRFPLVVEVLGWISVLAALLLAVMGRSNFQRLITWAFSLGKALGTAGGVLALCLGGFLVYAFA